MPCQNCGSVIPFEEFLKSLIKYDSVSGSYGLNINLIQVADCSTLSSSISCGQQQDLEELIKKTCSLDDCNNLSINIFYSTRQ